VNSAYLCYVVLGGSLGSLARVLITMGMERWLGPGYPWGTTVVNLLGAFVIGFIWSLFEARGGLPEGVRLFAIAGFLGAFTTFSALVFEAARLLSTERASAALLHLTLHNVLGLGCVFFGLWLGRR
jgi:fluoride exporter